MTTDVAVGRAQRRVTPVWLRRRGWTLGVWVLLIVLVGWYATLIPKFGAFQITSIAKNGLPLIYLAIGQAIIVTTGGIDLSVGAMLVLANSIAAQLMFEQPFWVTLAVAVLVLAIGGAINASVGWVITVSRVPDIVVTLATSFILAGLALVVLPSPGGGTSEGFRAMFTGSPSGSGSNFVPPILAIAIPTTLAAWWMKRTRTGLSLYATGSSLTAAYLSGVRTARAKIISYAVGGAFAALGGLSSLAITGSGESRSFTGGLFTLRSVAAIVLGGVALTGGIGSVVGAAAAGIILIMLSPILSARGIDPNSAQVVEGVLIVAVMIVAGVIELRRQRAS